MEKKRFLAVLLGTGLAVAAPWQVFAQSSDAAAPQAPAAAVPQAVTDGGVETVREAQAAEAPEVEQDDAEATLVKLMEQKGWNQGWDEKRQRFIAVGVAASPVRILNPAKDADFHTLRRGAAMRAILSAKAQIIQFLQQKMSAEQQVLIPGTDLNKALNAEVEELMRDVNEQKEVLASLLEKKNRAEAAKLRGATFGDRLNELMVAAIKKLDKEYTGKERDKVLAERYAKAVRIYNQKNADYQKLLLKAKAKRKEVVQTYKNAVRSMAEMPLFGATAVMQTESWAKDGTYQVAVMVVWSNVLERAARAVATGQPYSIQKAAGSKALSIHEWLAKQDLSVMIGPRQYVDKDGVRWFLGIAAASISKRLAPGIRDNNRQNAAKMASGEALLSISGDYNMQEAAQELIRVYDAGKNAEGNTELTAEAAKSMEQILRAKSENMYISGGQILVSKPCKHPITGDMIYVVVYGFNPNHIRSALAALGRNRATKEEALRHQTYLRGRNAAAAERIRKAANDPKDFRKGYTDQNQSLTKELNSRRPKKAPAPKGTRVYHKGGAVQPAAPATSTAGSFGGDITPSDNF